MKQFSAVLLTLTTVLAAVLAASTPATAALSHATATSADDGPDEGGSVTDVTGATFETTGGRAVLRVTFVNAPRKAVGDLTIAGRFTFGAKRSREWTFTAMDGVAESARICDVDASGDGLTRCSGTAKRVKGRTVVLSTKLAHLFPKGVPASTRTLTWNATTTSVTELCGDSACTDTVAKKPVRHKI